MARRGCSPVLPAVALDVIHPPPFLSLFQCVTPSANGNTESTPHLHFGRSMLITSRPTFILAFHLRPFYGGGGWALLRGGS